MRFYVRAGAVVAVHDDSQIISPDAYGIGVIVYRVPQGHALPARSSSGLFAVPAPTPAVLAASIKDECGRRIMDRISETTQRNLSAYAALLAATPLRSAAQDDDLAAIAAIFGWIGRPDGMQAASDTLIAAGVAGSWADDGNWPAWNAAWDELVSRF